MGEFVEAYSDDQIYLELLERMVAADEVESVVPEKIIASSLSRLWATVMVGAIETMIKSWRTDHYVWHEIGRYMDPGDNENRIQRLHEAFRNFGIELDEELFQDFLAVKYIRNSYIHGNWNDNHRQFVISRDFPGNLMHFTPEHLARIKAIYQPILNALGTVKARVALLAFQKSGSEES